MSGLAIRIIAVRLDEDEKIANPRKDLHRFLPGMTFKRPMDMELGPDGCLYLIQWGNPMGDNNDTQLIRLSFTATLTLASLCYRFFMAQGFDYLLDATITHLEALKAEGCAASILLQ